MLPQAALYLLCNQFPENPISMTLISIQKMLGLINKYNSLVSNNGTVYVPYREAIARFYRSKNTFMKLSTIEQHLNDIKENCSSKLVQLNWEYLKETSSEMHKEMDNLEFILTNFEKHKKESWFGSWWYDPPYLVFLNKIEKLQDEFETRFDWYLKISTLHANLK